MDKDKTARLLEKIRSWLENDGIKVTCVDPGRLDGEIIHDTLIRAAVPFTDSWEYFKRKVNECYPVCKITPTGSEIIISFYSVNAGAEKNVLAEDLQRFYDCLQKQYYKVSPTRDYFSVLIKPTHRCNLDCKYCYERPYRERIKEDMPIETLEKIIYLLSKYASNVQLIWHGGEPTMVGIEWFEEAQKVIQKYPMTQFEQHLMSNGLNYNKDWADLFIKYNIKPGMSYDVYSQGTARGYGRAPGCYGYHEQHKIRQEERDLRRINLEHTLKYLRRRGLEIGTITVVTEENCTRLIDMYEHLKKINISTCFNTVFWTEGSARHGLLFEPAKYAEEFAKFFKHWLYDEDGIYERSAAEALGFVMGSDKAACANQDCRLQWLGFIPTGEIYPCDRYFSDKYRCGHIDDFNSIEEVFESPAYKLYYSEIQQRFDTYCAECGYWQMCKGGCNGNPIELYGDASKTSEFECETFRLKFKEVYKILRNIDVVSDRLNPEARKMMVENGFYSVSDIKKYMHKAGVLIEMEFNEDDILNCSEYKIFRYVNPFKEFRPPLGHINYIFGYSPEAVEVNYENREKSFFERMKLLRGFLPAAAEGASVRTAC